MLCQSLLRVVFFNCRYTEKKAKSKKKKKNKHGKDESSKIKSSSSSKDKLPAIGSSLEKTKNAAFDRLRDDAASSSGIEQALITFTSKSMRVVKFWLDKFTSNKLLYRFVKFLGKCLSQTAVHKTKF